MGDIEWSIRILKERIREINIRLLYKKKLNIIE